MKETGWGWAGEEGEGVSLGGRQVLIPRYMGHNISHITHSM